MSHLLSVLLIHTFCWFRAGWATSLRPRSAGSPVTKGVGGTGLEFQHLDLFICGLIVTDSRKAHKASTRWNWSPKQLVAWCKSRAFFDHWCCFHPVQQTKKLGQPCLFQVARGAVAKKTPNISTQKNSEPMRGTQDESFAIFRDSRVNVKDCTGRPPLVRNRSTWEQLLIPSDPIWSLKQLKHLKHLRCWARNTQSFLFLRFRDSQLEALGHSVFRRYKWG